MTDQIPADKVRPILDEWERIKEYADWEDMDNLVQDVRALLPPPGLPTMADMSREERRDCQWMQADVPRGRAVIILTYASGGSAVMLDRRGGVKREDPDTVTPRPDLPRMEWPGEQQPAPAPALPEGWRLADHQKHGRVIVTNPTPNIEGRVYYVLPSADPLGFDWLFCDPGDLTYLDTDQEVEDVTPVKAGDVIESADDPRLDALPIGSILLDRDGEAVTKRREEWEGGGRIPIPYEGEVFGPWTVLHIPKKADQ